MKILYYEPVVGDNNGEPTYVIKASLKFSRIWEAISEAQTGPTRFVLVDERGNYLFCDDNRRVLRERFVEVSSDDAEVGEAENDIYAKHSFTPSHGQNRWDADWPENPRKRLLV